MAVKTLLNKVMGKRDIGISDMIQVGSGAYFGLDTYQTAREEGDSKLTAGMKGIADAALPMMMSMPEYLGLQLISEAPSAALSAYTTMSQKQREVSRQASTVGKAFANSTFNDNEQMYTMRQAGQAIAERSRYNIQQAQLGREASFMMK